LIPFPCGARRQSKPICLGFVKESMLESEVVSNTGRIESRGLKFLRDLEGFGIKGGGANNAKTEEIIAGIDIEPVSFGSTTEAFAISPA
jgi:hypothetical protein